MDVEFEAVESAFHVVFGVEYARLLLRSSGRGTQCDQPTRGVLDEAEFSNFVSRSVLPGALLDERTDGEAYATARKRIRQFSEHVRDFLKEVDVLLALTLRSLPPPVESVDPKDERVPYTLTVPFSFTGGPVVSVPGFAVDGLPVGIQVIGSPFDDGHVLEWAERVERLVERRSDDP